MLQKLLRILQSATALIAIIFFIWFVAPFKYGVLNPGNILGCIICLYFIIRFGFNRNYNFIKKLCYKRGITKFFWRFFAVVKYVFALYAVIISGLMIGFSLHSPSANNSPTAVVLGAEVKAWGPSEVLKQRIDAAEVFLKEHPDSYAVATGGKGADEVMSEAQCIYENLIAREIPKSRVLIEDKAVNTWENIEFSNKIIKGNDKISSPDIAVISESYHQFRAWIIAKKQGVDGNVYAVNDKNGSTGLILYPTMFVREWIAIPAELIK